MSDTEHRLVYKIVATADWTFAVAGGEFAGSADDARDGFIHLSTAAQVAATAARHFADRDGLSIVAVDPAALGAALRYEPSRGGAMFPHLYGVLHPAAVAWIAPLPRGRDGRHVLPAGVV